METWLLLTFLGAFLQNIRSFLQRRITDNLSINGSSFVRFLFAIPLAFVVVLLLVDRIPSLPWTFLGYVIAGGIAQIVGTSCLISAVVKGNFPSELRCPRPKLRRRLSLASWFWVTRLPSPLP